jgi:NagD protein
MFFIDVQGTLIDDIDKKPIRGAIEFIDALNVKNTPYMIITNNTKVKSEEFLKYLNSIGLNIPKSRYIDPLMILKEVLTAKSVAPYGSYGFIENIKNLGFELDYKTPEAVVLSVKKDYSFEEFGDIDEFLLRGAKLVGMHKTSLYAKEKRYPGVGALMAMFEFATGVKGEVVGKPSRIFFDKALKKIGAKSFKDITIISDDVVGDLQGAAKLGMRSVFVLSGKFKSAEEILPKIDFKPDIIAKDMLDAAKRLGVL